MENKILFLLTLVCEHCNQRTVLFRDIDELESQCANGECMKISKLDREAKFNAYIKFLETEYIDLEKKCDTIVPAYNTTVNLYKTKNGWRLVLNNKKSIQFALTENISDL